MKLIYITMLINDNVQFNNDENDETTNKLYSKTRLKYFILFKCLWKLIH